MYKTDADYLLQNRRYLSDGIYVDKEYCKDIEEKRKKLRPYLTAVCRIPHYQHKCKLEQGTLVVRGVNYTMNDLDCLPANLKGFNISSKTENSVFSFFGSINPLSNFHPSPFLFEGQAFHCIEQLIQLKKAQYFKDEDTAPRILSAKTGIECKLLSKELKNYNHELWKQVAKDRCLDGILHKFLQNPILQKMLQATG